MSSPDWKPGRRAQAFEWWLKQTFRIGGGLGLVYETAVRGLQDPLAILSFTLLTVSVDAYSFARALLRYAREEAIRIAEEQQKQGTRDGDGEGSRREERGS